MNNVDNFIDMFFNVVVHEEDPNIILDVLNDNMDAIASMSTYSNDDIDKAILTCHAQYIQEENSIPYESISHRSIGVQAEYIKNSDIDEGKAQLLHAIYRIQYHFVDFQAIHKTLKQYVDLQTKQRVDEASEKIIHQAKEEMQKIQFETTQLATETTQTALTNLKEAAINTKKRVESCKEIN